MTASTFTFNAVSDTEVVITRRFAAPRHLVFAACSEPRHLVHWWGRRGSTLPVCEIDARPGGSYRFVERGADGVEHPFKGEYREVTPPERAVFTQIYDVPPLDQYVMTVDITLTEEDGGRGTLLTERLIFASREERDGAMGSGMAEGAGESLERLAERLALLDAEEQEIVLVRHYAAPRRLVFRAWTEQQHLDRWFGPDGFTTATSEMEARPGGLWRYTMTGPDGTVYPNRVAYLEVAAPERLVYLHDDDGGGEEPFHVTLTFTEEPDGTTVTMRSRFASAEVRRAVEGFGAVTLGYQTLDRLGGYLARWHPPGAGPLGETRSTVTLEGERDMVMARVFAAPRALVFRAWTAPEQIVRWWGPRGWQTTVYEMDVRPGGRWHYCMRSEEGQESWGLTRYREVVAPELLAYTDAFSDKDANSHPPEMEITVTFAEQDGGRATLVTSRTTLPTSEMRGQIIDMGAIPGMEETLDRLAELLAE